jgi:hypothetical protein
MTEEVKVENVEAEEVKLYEVRLYMKSGNIIEMSNLLSFDFSNSYSSKSITWKYHPDDNTFNVMGGNSLDLDQIEAITTREQEGFKL